jgi:hypothetical protein
MKRRALASRTRCARRACSSLSLVRASSRCGPACFRRRCALVDRAVGLAFFGFLGGAAI